MSPRLSLPQALAWIVGSMLVVCGGAHRGLSWALKHRQQKAKSTEYALYSIVQTGPQKEALKTEYLAELMGLSVDRPVSTRYFDTKKAETALMTSPLIKEARVKIVPPSGIYIDYSMRQPLAWIGDFENIAVDQEGYLFPVRPFLSPKILPEIYFGLAPFGQDSTICWGRPLKGKEVDLAFSLFKILSDAKIEMMHVRRIDVSSAFADSYGQRQIVVAVEDRIPVAGGPLLIVPRLLRLTTKHYAQELGHFLQLRQQLLQQEKASLSPTAVAEEEVRLEEKVIDFRIEGLAFL